MGCRRRNINCATALSMAKKTPRRFIRVDAIGRHANGKIDHARIRAIVANASAS